MQLELEVKKLSYTFEDGAEALKDVSFSIDKGETIAVMGPNGAGKSTLLWVLMKALKGYSGSINICGIDIEKITGDAFYRTLNIVFQNPENQIFCATVEDEICFALDNLGVNPGIASEKLKEIAGVLGISDLLKKEPQHLSFGQKKRVALASVLIIKPLILLLDEPSSNLDFLNKKKLITAVNEFQGSKIIVTQDIHFALSVAKRIIYMENGIICYDGAFDNPGLKLKCPDLDDEIIDIRQKISKIK